MVVAWCVLMCACLCGNVEVVRLLLKAPDIDLDLVDWDERKKWSALFYAASIGHEEIVVLLLKAGCNRNLVDAEGKRAGKVAAERGRTICAALIESDPYKVHIHDVCFEGKVTHVLAFLRQGCPCGYRDERGGGKKRTPLMAAAKGGAADVVRLLLRYEEGRQSVWASDEDGNTALHLACSVGSLECCGLLLGAGGNRARDAKNNRGETAQDVAGQFGVLFLVSFLAQGVLY